MRGQIKVEFVLAVVVFAFVTLVVMTQLNSTFNIIASDSKTDTVRTKANDLINLLVEDPQWMSAGQPYNLSKSKISVIDLNRDATGQCSSFIPMRLGGYRLTVANSTHTLLRCGAAGVGSGAVSIARAVWIENDYGIITVEMW